MERSVKVKYSSVGGVAIEEDEMPPSPINQQQKRARDLSPDDILDYIGFGPFQVIAFFLSGLAYFSYGSDISIFVFIGDSVTEQFNVTKTEYALLPGSTAIPNVIGAVTFSFISDRYGRWWPYAVVLGWMGVFSIASAWSPSFVVLVVLRCATSFAIGGLPAIVIPTVIEFLPTRSRGSVVVMNMMMAILGVCLSCGLAWWLIPTYPLDGWRFYVTAVAVPTLLVAAFRLIFFIESPRYLIANGKFKRAWKVFEIIARFNGKKLTDFITFGEFSERLAVSVSSKKGKFRQSLFGQLLQIFSVKYLRRTLPLSVIVVTESMGYLSSQLFLPDYLHGLGISTYFTLMVTALAQIPGVLLLAIIVEWPKVGRLNSLRFYTFLAIVFFLLLTIVQTDITIPLFLIFIYFAAGPIQGLFYTYVSEAYPTSIRSITSSYFYVLQALTYLTGSLISSTVANDPRHWIFPAVFTVMFFVQFCMSLVLNYEPLGKKLIDVMD